jgi:hypothetical protein
LATLENNVFGVCKENVNLMLEIGYYCLKLVNDIKIHFDKNRALNNPKSIVSPKKSLSVGVFGAF